MIGRVVLCGSTRTGHRSRILVVALLSTHLMACGDDAFSGLDPDVHCATHQGPIGIAPWGLDPAIVPDDEPSIRSTMGEMATLFAKYDLTFSFGSPSYPICFSVLEVDQDHIAADGRVSEYHMGIEVPIRVSGGYPGDNARQFLKALAVRAGEAEIGSRILDLALEGQGDLVYLTSTVHLAEEGPGLTHYGFAWGVADSPWVFLVDARTPQERANVVRAFAEASRTAARSDTRDTSP
jgi:hypothetical protein